MFVRLYCFATGIVKVFFIEIDFVLGTCHSDKEKQTVDGLGSKDVGVLDDLSAIILPPSFFF